MGVGQHYTQAAYMGRFYGITNLENKPGRNIQVRIIETKEILKLKDSPLTKEELRIKLKSLVMGKAAEKIFSGTFLSKAIENKEQIGSIEDQFIANCDKYDFSGLFSIHNHDIFKLTMKYFSLHEARNFENFSFIRKEIQKFLASEQPIRKFIEHTYYFDQLENEEQKNTIEKLLLELKKPKLINNNQLFEQKIKEIFNFLYLIVWKKLEIDFNRRNWFVIGIGSGLGMGNNLVLKLQKPLYNNYKSIISYLYLPEAIKELIDNSIIIFLGNNEIAIGSRPQITEFPKIKPFPIQLLVNNYNYIYRFLISLSVTHAYKQIIISDDAHLEFLLNAFTLDFKSFILSLEETNAILG